MKCCICGKELEDAHSNNPQPMKREDGAMFDAVEERCCNACNSKFVVPYRIAKIKEYFDDMADLQLEVFNLRKAAGINAKKKYVVCVIEREDGTTYEQQCELLYNSVKRTVNHLQSMLGKDYLVCAARVVEAD